MKKILQLVIILTQASSIYAQSPVLLKDINPGAESGLNSFFSNSPKYIVGLKGKAYFAANDPVNGVELWQSDGTTGGTLMLKDINPGTASSEPKDFIEYNGALYFTATTAASGRELWRTDGTVAGTVLVKDIRPGLGDSDIAWLTIVKGKLYFGATGPNGENEPYVSDGTTAGTNLLVDLPSISLGSFPGGFVEHLGDIYFFAGGFASTGSQVWKSDGTAAGTTLIFEDFYISPLFSAGQYLLFHSGFKSEKLWKSDGTKAGTTLLRQDMDYPKFFTEYKGKIFFINAGQAWETDGTAVGTKNISTLEISTFQLEYYSLLLWGDQLYFSAQNQGGSLDQELYRYDGTSISIVKEIAANPFGSEPRYLTAVKNYFVFRAADNTKGPEVWKSDGTEAGTQLLADVEPGFIGSEPQAFAYIGGNLFFSASTSSKGRELYKIDINTGSSELLHGAAIATIFPNPMESTMNFQVKPDAQGIQIDILDLTGTLIFSQKSIESIDVSKFAAGLYLVHVRDHQGVQVEKIIKQ